MTSAGVDGLAKLDLALLLPTESWETDSFLFIENLFYVSAIRNG